MNTLTYPLAPDHEDRDAARVAADLRALPTRSTTRSSWTATARGWLRYRRHSGTVAPVC